MQPEEKIAVMMLYNGYLAGFEANKLIYTILDQLLQLPDQAPEIQMIEPDRSAWSSYVGTYLSINYGGLATILMEQEHLQLHLNGTIFPLEAHRKDLYVGLDTHNNTWVPVAFLPEEKGPTQYIVINGRSFKRFEQDAAFYPDPISWARYVGTYKGDGGTLLISLEGEQLHIRDVEGKGKANCIPLDTTRFACQMGVIEFLLNEDNTVIELLLANAWHYPYIP